MGKVSNRVHISTHKACEEFAADWLASRVESQLRDVQNCRPADRVGAGYTAVCVRAAD